MLVMGVLILPLGEHQKILTISFTRVFSLALNAMQFTFEIRCRGEQNVTRHVAVVPFFFVQCSLFTATEPQKKSMQVKKEVFLDFSLPLLLGDEISILFKHSKHTFETEEKSTLLKNNNNASKVELN